MNMVPRSTKISQVVESVQNGQIDLNELTHWTRAEINRYEPRLKAWVELVGSTDEDHDERGKQTGQNQRRPLAGLQVGVKDIIDVAGMPTRCGSVTADQRIRESDAACVQRLRELGAVIQGKTVTTEYGYFSPGATTNPFSSDHTPGGSSSGSAAAVGAGTIPFALGTQTAGSLTRPASFCGVAGLVLSAGSTSMEGISGMSKSLDSLGFLASTTEDLDFVYRHFADRVGDSSVPVDELTAFVWEGSGLLNLDPAMIGLLKLVPQVLAKIGVHTRDLQWDDHIRSLVDDHKSVMGYEAARSLGKQLGENRQSVSLQLQQLLDAGDTVTDAAYGEALFRRDVSHDALLRLLGENAVIIGPAAHGPAPRVEEGTGSPELSRPWQLMGLPVVTVPGAKTSSGLPLGLQIIGRQGNELSLLQLAQELESLLRRLPSLSDDSNPSLKEMKW